MVLYCNFRSLASVGVIGFLNKAAKNLIHSYTCSQEMVCMGVGRDPLVCLCKALLNGLVLECGHGPFHQRCLQRLVTVNASSRNAVCCPICRQTVSQEWQQAIGQHGTSLLPLHVLVRGQLGPGRATAYEVPLRNFQEGEVPSLSFLAEVSKY